MRHPPSHLPQCPILELLLANDPIAKALLGSINKRLDEMLSTLFSPYIISYEPPRGFQLPKFMMYDGTNDLFDHLMHFRQLMMLDVSNGVLLCKVFSASLHCSTLS
ncbi:hypothetical protein CK203_054766 [Vitis vinifera]|uniref:Uncharacterized protein n=1 Tax=Vitis vinifera TaxID=29760 RepID=A0A438GIN7_VITVI|nr:hypothetical protein CK203_054766 [Vitis vinifera]